MDLVRAPGVGARRSGALSEGPVRYELRERVARLTLARPEKRNAFNDVLYDALRDALLAAREDEGVGAVLLSGEGAGFSAGQDLSELGRTGEGSEGTSGFPPFMDAVQAFDKPLLAAVHGAAVGIGTTLLLHCDVVYVGESARLRLPFSSLGIVPEAASSALLPMIVGPQRAAELFYTAEWIPAERALELGLAAARYPDADLLEAAFVRAREIAAQPLPSLRETKRLLLAQREPAVRAARERENAAMARTIGSPENREAVRAFREKRAPDFRRAREESRRE